ncbi:response regulator [Tateyamaria omphalii]|uniref:Response regulator n=1 Tax=Tateyamaria omphalii TaxID=299262 RepID=A0A1P8MSS1_9RHOB|nr:response regulator [Tateyamaria omphalii]APX11137.1 response regulator [Tateyamaria omphalii]
MQQQKKVLLIEDDQFSRFMMKEVIDMLGVGVDIAENGKQGCDTLDDNPEDYGLVLMDLHMPEMSGIDATNYIRTRVPPNAVPIIAVTADVDYHNAQVVKKLGMNGFASKPVSPGHLMDLIDQYCPVH